MICVEALNFEQWRNHARELLKRQVAPESISWQIENQAMLFEHSDSAYLDLPVVEPQPRISREFLSLAKTISCHRRLEKWSLLYSVAWRLLNEDDQLLSFEIDPQVKALNQMSKSIARDKHKMKAFVRFQKISEQGNADLRGKPQSALAPDTEHFVAWFEPEHLIVEATAPFFATRFKNMRWSILTPSRCAHWDLARLSFTAGVTRPKRIEEDLEKLWLEYYANIFNPARLKLKAMQSEMPKKYWINLPEAKLIKELTRQSAQQTNTMIHDSVTAPCEKNQKSLYIKNVQEALRSRNGDTD